MKFWGLTRREEEPVASHLRYARHHHRRRPRHWDGYSTVTTGLAVLSCRPGARFVSQALNINSDLSSLRYRQSQFGNVESSVFQAWCGEAASLHPVSVT